ncbi:MAG TPA: hypothetical protein VHQ93_14410 [Chitinophagaceae bacterium]|jgi:hypothetical protein|nr:hypothetical protein [Chitinophagaceae bacterium]
MKFSLRHIILLVGIMMVILSFIFFSREDSFYSNILLAGLILSAFGYILILFKENSIKQKIFWTLAVICGVAVQYVTEAPLIKKSYSIFINKNHQILGEANEIMNLKPDGIYGLDTSDLLMGKLNEMEFSKLKALKEKAGVRFISKDRDIIFYCLSGAIDIHNGVYFINKIRNDGPAFTHLKDKWYY